MGLIHETAPILAAQSPNQLIVTASLALGGIAGAVKTIKNSYKIVHQGEMGVRLRKGMPRTYIDKNNETHYKTVGPKVHWLVPFIDSIETVETRVNTDPIDPFPIETSDNQQYFVHSAISWQVMENGDNPYKALFNVNNKKGNEDIEQMQELRKTVGSTCRQSLRETLLDRSSHELKTLSHEVVERGTKDRCAEPLAQFGVELTSVQVHALSRTDAEVLKQGLERAQTPGLDGVIAFNALHEQTADRANVIQLRPNSDDAA